MQSQFKDWATLYDPEAGHAGSTELVEYPGHGASANPTLINDMEVLVKYLVDHLKLEQQEEPYALLGHSMGAIVAFEACPLTSPMSLCVNRCILSYLRLAQPCQRC